MKTTISIIALATAVGLGAPIAGAQDTAPKKENRTEEVSEYLGLNSDQQKQVAEIYKNEAAKTRALAEETRQQINALLTPDQQEKYNEFLSVRVIEPKSKAKEKEQDKPACNTGK